MLSWSTKRQLVYLAIVAGFFVLLFSYPLFSFLSRAPSCTDGVENQGELGVDCGGPCSAGPCSALCPFQVSDLIVLWARVFPVGDGTHNAVVFIENPNINAGVKNISYSFKLYDKDNVLVVERKGETFINPKERFTIFEGGILAGERIPVRAFFEFVEEPQWVKANEPKPTLLIRNTEFLDSDIKPKIKAELISEIITPLEDIIIVALLFDEKNNVLAVSKTEVDLLPASSLKMISFIFPLPLAQRPSKIEIMPRVHMFEVD